MTTGFIYLASASPRRRELLDQIGVPFRVLKATVSEDCLQDEDPASYVERVALDKADDVWRQVEAAEPAPVLAADTAVVVDRQIFGKPADETEALAMLDKLSGRPHQVLTAIALRWQDRREAAVSRNEVRFRPTTADERLAYCRTDEPFDKAGAYAIQGRGALFIEHLNGSYSAVMGLPLFETARMLARFGMPPWLGAEMAGQ